MITAKLLSGPTLGADGEDKDQRGPDRSVLTITNDAGTKSYHCGPPDPLWCASEYFPSKCKQPNYTEWYEHTSRTKLGILDTLKAYANKACDIAQAVAPAVGLIPGGSSVAQGIKTGCGFVDAATQKTTTPSAPLPPVTNWVEKYRLEKGNLWVPYIEVPPTPPTAEQMAKQQALIAFPNIYSEGDPVKGKPCVIKIQRGCDPPQPYQDAPLTAEEKALYKQLTGKDWAAQWKVKSGKDWQTLGGAFGLTLSATEPTTLPPEALAAQQRTRSINWAACGTCSAGMQCNGLLGKCASMNVTPCPPGTTKGASGACNPAYLGARAVNYTCPEGFYSIQPTNPTALCQTIYKGKASTSSEGIVVTQATKERYICQKGEPCPAGFTQDSDETPTQARICSRPYDPKNNLPQPVVAALPPGTRPSYAQCNFLGRGKCCKTSGPSVRAIPECTWKENQAWCVTPTTQLPPQMVAVGPVLDTDKVVLDRCARKVFPDGRGYPPGIECIPATADEIAKLTVNGKVLYGTVITGKPGAQVAEAQITMFPPGTMHYYDPDDKMYHIAEPVKAGGFGSFGETTPFYIEKLSSTDPTTQGSTPSDKSTVNGLLGKTWYKKWYVWVGIAAVVGGGAYYFVRRRRAARR